GSASVQDACRSVIAQTKAYRGHCQVDLQLPVGSDLIGLYDEFGLSTEALGERLRGTAISKLCPGHILHFFVRVVVTSRQTADAPHRLRGVERRAGRADDHFPAHYGPPAATL